MNSFLFKFKINNMNHVIKNAINIIVKNKQVIKYGLISNTLFGILMRGLGDSIHQFG